MKRLILAIVLILVMAGIAQAVLPTSEAITVANAAIGFTASIIQSNPVTLVSCSAETAQMRFRVDGTDPTTSVGHVLEAGQWICIGNCTGLGQASALQQITNFRAIRTGSTSGLLFCTYE